MVYRHVKALSNVGTWFVRQSYSFLIYSSFQGRQGLQIFFNFIMTPHICLQIEAYTSLLMWFIHHLFLSIAALNVTWTLLVDQGSTVKLVRTLTCVRAVLKSVDLTSIHSTEYRNQVRSVASLSDPWKGMDFPQCSSKVVPFVEIFGTY